MHLSHKKMIDVVDIVNLGCSKALIIVSKIVSKLKTNRPSQTYLGRQAKIVFLLNLKLIKAGAENKNSVSSQLSNFCATLACSYETRA